MSVEARIKAAMNDSRLQPDANGDHVEEVTIRGGGLDLMDVKNHDLVEDAIQEGSNIVVWVKASSPGGFVSTT